MSNDSPTGPTFNIKFKMHDDYVDAFAYGLYGLPFGPGSNESILRSTIQIHQSGLDMNRRQRGEVSDTLASAKDLRRVVGRYATYHEVSKGLSAFDHIGNLDREIERLTKRLEELDATIARNIDLIWVLENSARIVKRVKNANRAQLEAIDAILYPPLESRPPGHVEGPATKPGRRAPDLIEDYEK